MLRKWGVNLLKLLDPQDTPLAIGAADNPHLTEEDPQVSNFCRI